MTFKSEQVIKMVNKHTAVVQPNTMQAEKKDLIIITFLTFNFIKKLLDY